MIKGIRASKGENQFNSELQFLRHFLKIVKGDVTFLYGERTKKLQHGVTEWRGVRARLERERDNAETEYHSSWSSRRNIHCVTWMSVACYWEVYQMMTETCPSQWRGGPWWPEVHDEQRSVVSSTQMPWSSRSNWDLKWDRRKCRGRDWAQAHMQWAPESQTPRSWKCWAERRWGIWEAWFWLYIVEFSP